MRLGASLGYFAALGDPRDDLDFARAAERLGYDSVWVAEPYGNDAATVLAWFAGATERVRLGSSIMAMPGRTPAMCAQTAATLDLISDGRLVLGLGTSGPQVAEGWHGQSFAKPLLRTREYVDVVRMALRREPLRYDGETIVLPRPGDVGKPLRLILTPRRNTIPIWLAALGPRAVLQAGEIADGWIPMWWAPEHAARLLEPLAEGAARAGRDRAAIALAPSVLVRVDDDLATARDAMRAPLALYVGGMGSRDRNFYASMVARYGFEREAGVVQELFLAGRRAEAAAAIPDALIDMTCLVGPLERVRDRLAAYREAGVDELLATPVAPGEDDRVEQLQLLARAAGRL